MWGGLMPGCPFPSGYFENKVTGQKIPARCNTWTCPHCGPIKKNKLLDRVTAGSARRHGEILVSQGLEQFATGKVKVGGGYRLRFMTLPLSPQASRLMSITKDCWPKFRASAWEAGYKITHYFWTREQTKAGAWHLHIVMNAYVPWQLIQKWWLNATDGRCRVVDIEAAPENTPIARMASYMAKYITKTVDVSEYPKGVHRYGFSRDVAWKVELWVPPGETAEQKVWTFDYNPHPDENWWEYWRLKPHQNALYEKYKAFHTGCESWILTL